MGPNGAGKTTLFNAITRRAHPRQPARVALPRRGRQRRCPPHLRAARGMGRTFQLIGLAKHQSVFENLLIAQHLGAPYSVARR